MEIMERRMDMDVHDSQIWSGRPVAGVALERGALGNGYIAVPVVQGHRLKQ